MDSSIEVNRSPAKTVQGNQVTGSAASPRAQRGDPGELPKPRVTTAAGNATRVSLDPLRATDRYRLVLPIDDRV